MDYPKISAIIPGRDCSQTIGNCLSSIRAQDLPAGCLEIIYVDDASTDGSADIAAPLVDRIERFEEFPRGPAAARNAGARAAKGEILFFCDSDITAPPGTIRSLVEHMVNDRGLDAVFGSYDSEPSARSLVSQYRNLFHHFVHQSSRAHAATFWAGCGAIRKRSFEMTGGFDADHYKNAMIEDIELGHRMIALGMKIRLQRSVQVKHLKEWTLLKMIRSDVFSRGIPWMRLLFRDNLVSREIGDLNLKVSAMLSVIMAWAGLLLLFMSAYRLGFIYGALFSWLVVVLANLRTYRFFWRIRGPQFAVMIIPLNFIFHLCNGVSVIAALVYHVFIDNPISRSRAPGNGREQGYRRRPDK